MYTIYATTRRLRAAVLTTALAATSIPAFGQATTQPVPRGGIREVTPAIADGAATERSATTRDGDAATAQRVIPLYAGESRLVKAPWPVKRLSVNNPAIADVDVVSPDQVQLIALTPGVTDLIMWSATDQVWRARVDVEADVSKLRQQLERLFPGAELEVAQVGDVVAISGQFAKAEQASHLRTYLEQSGLKHMDMTRLAGVQQVQLKVRVAEVSRNALKAMGVNTLILGDDFFGGVQIGSSTGPLVPMNVGSPGGATPGNSGVGTVGEGGIGTPPGVTMFGGIPNSDLQFWIQALAENQYLRVLSEPTLVALSGQEASFLAGGEFPVPVAQLGEGGTTAISIEYREFGVRLNFKPTVLGDGMMRLQVTPEVSELSDVGAVEVLGTRVPSLLTRRVITTLEIESGQTFSIAGLISNSTNARNSRVPGLGDLPVLGPLFRSTRYASSETELVILVTASLVEPQNTSIHALPVPGAGFKPPTAWEFYALGQVEGRPSKLSPAHRERLKELGLNDLRGPGAWASHDSNQAQTKAEVPRKN
jgi:pilus assembly protein CpaC